LGEGRVAALLFEDLWRLSTITDLMLLPVVEEEGWSIAEAKDADLPANFFGKRKPDDSREETTERLADTHEVEVESAVAKLLVGAKDAGLTADFFGPINKVGVLYIVVDKTDEADVVLEVGLVEVTEAGLVEVAKDGLVICLVEDLVEVAEAGLVEVAEDGLVVRLVEGLTM